MDDNKLKEILKTIRLKLMCDETGINYKRIKNYASGYIRSLTEEEIEKIKSYVKEKLEW